MRSNPDIEDALARYGDSVLRACRATLSRSSDAEDIFQEVFIKYASHDEAFTDEEHRKAWLLRVAINASRDHLRKASEHNVPLEDANEISISTQAESVETRMTMKEALGLLNENQRTAVLLSVVEGYSAKEISQIMDMPENTEYSHIMRGKQRLREVLER